MTENATNVREKNVTWIGQRRGNWSMVHHSIFCSRRPSHAWLVYSWCPPSSRTGCNQYHAAGGVSPCTTLKRSCCRRAYDSVWVDALLASSLSAADYRQTFRHRQKRKYITYCNDTEAKRNHGHWKHVREKSGEVWTYDSREMRADRQTDSSYTVQKRHIIRVNSHCRISDPSTCTSPQLNAIVYTPDTVEVAYGAHVVG